jgi:hypothetical protein
MTLVARSSEEAAPPPAFRLYEVEGGRFYELLSVVPGLDLWEVRVVVDGSGREVVVGTEEQVARHFSNAAAEGGEGQKKGAESAKQRASGAAAAGALASAGAPPAPPLPRMWPGPPPPLVVRLPRRVVPGPGHCTATLSICSRLLVRMRVAPDGGGEGEGE